MRFSWFVGCLALCTLPLAAQDYALQQGPRLPRALAASAVADLADGGAVTAGGFFQEGTSPTVAISEVYRLDPTTQNWSTVGTLSAGRGFGTATRLASGQVLFVGGAGANGTSLGNVDRFDPATLQVQPVAGLATPRQQHTATLLADGRVLVLGGGDASQSLLDSGEIFDPASGTWSATAPMPRARASHFALCLLDGRVLVVRAAGTPVDIYDPNANTWTTLPAPTNGASSATLLADGRVLLTAVNAADAEIYDPANGQRTPAGTTANAGAFYGSFRLPSGRVLALGFSTAEVFDPLTNTWSFFSRLRLPRWLYGAAQTTDGRVLLVGGLDQANVTVDSTETLDPRIGRWAPAASMATPRSSHTATVLRDGRVLVAGGFGPDRRAVEIFDPVSETWTPTTPLLEGRAGHTAALLPNGEVLVVGGIGPSEASAEIFNPATQQWRSAGFLSGGVRAALTSILLPNGNVLICGGSSQFAALFVTATGMLQQLPPMSNARTTPALGLLPDGRVLVAAGDFMSAAASDTSEFFDPATGTFAPGPALQGRHSTVSESPLLPSSKLVVHGGTGAISSTEVFDAASGTWSTTSREYGSVEAALVALADGRLLATGGVRVTDSYRAAGERIFDPTTSRWLEAASFAQRRVQHRSVRLPDGRVLVTGGYEQVGGTPDLVSLASCEIFTPSVQAAQPVVGAVQVQAQSTTLTWQAAGANRPFRLEFAASPAATWQRQPGVQFSDAAGLLQFVDATLPRPASRFYRVVQLP
ncbi:MAG: hypothetical protein JSR82_05560 [Verrucomicrobia bacterium]|nr:hypothetical protein [Verrucomicrobiota bacterium]